ncbi:MAG: TRAFAC clade GTPase domain-containing protein [Janthinobacterium lividum]
MAESSVTIVGLPGSGKTTYLAALWAVLNERPEGAALRFRELGAGDRKYLNEIAKRWRSAHEQKRTLLSVQTVSLNMLGVDDQPVSITFPDLAGETFKRMWIDRSCSVEVYERLLASGLMVFVHADRIIHASYVREASHIANIAGETLVAGEPTAWSAETAPTQVQLVGLLDALRSPPFNETRRRVAVIISAWDRAEAEGLTPADYLAGRMPLLAQYIRQNLPDWDWRIYGVSAQGGEFDPDEKGKPRAANIDRLRELPTLAARIKTVGPEGESNDLTEPLSWILQ